MTASLRALELYGSFDSDLKRTGRYEPLNELRIFAHGAQRRQARNNHSEACEQLAAFEELYVRESLSGLRTVARTQLVHVFNDCFVPTFKASTL